MGAYGRARKDLSSHYREEGLYSLTLPVCEAHGTFLASRSVLQWDIIAGSSSEVGSTHPEGLAERTPDQAE